MSGGRFGSADFVPAHEVVGEAGEVVFLLHGILGAGRNWRSFARRIAAGPPARRIVLPDLRLHGRSKNAPPPDTLEACALDLDRLAERTGLRPSAVVGHSFGGKVAVAYAAVAPPDLERVVVLDSPLSPERPQSDEDVLPLRLLAFVERRPGPFAARADAVEELTAEGVPVGVARWFATNLERSEGGHRFVLETGRLRALLEDYFRFDALAVIERICPPRRFALVRAGASRRVRQGDVRRLRDFAAEGRPIAVLEVPGAGHWLHVDDPEGTRRALEEALGDGTGRARI